MKKMIVLTSLWSFLFIFSFSMFGCSEDDDEFGTTAERGNEVRTPPCGGDQWKSSGHLD